MSVAHFHTIEETPLESILGRIGHTPLYELKHFSKANVKIFAKLEWEQLGGSVKARPAAAMIRFAIEEKPFMGDERILEATSGNTGIAIAQIAREAGIPVTIILPRNASRKRIELLNSAGAEIIYSSPLEGTDGAQVLARKLVAEDPHKYRYLDQYNNEENFISHIKTTGPEIWQQTSGKVTHFITGLGTTGSFRGITHYLKSINSAVQCIALQPRHPMHGLEGWKHMETAKVPGIYDPDLADENWEVSTEEALYLVKEVYQKEGLWISPSSAANLAGALRLSGELEEGNIVTLFPDDGSKYPEIFNPFQL